jgi:hypothetical protein
MLMFILPAIASMFDTCLVVACILRQIDILELLVCSIFLAYQWLAQHCCLAPCSLLFLLRLHTSPVVAIFMQ